MVVHLSLTRAHSHARARVSCHAVPEAELNAMEIYDEIEKDSMHCEPGHYGRTQQYSDPEFTHDDSAIGAIQKAEMLQGWRVSQGININATLFKNGTDPDDVFQGQLNDGWLLSALSIVAASGGVGDDSVRAAAAARDAVAAGMTRARPACPRAHTGR
jgi:hypothetical protein